MPRMISVGRIPVPVAHTMQMNRFLGVDFTNIATQVDVRRSPDAVNMIPDLNGFPVKRKGYEKAAALSGRINGAYLFTTAEGISRRLVHAGTALHLLREDGSTEKLYEGMADAYSKAVQLEEKLMIADGKRLLCCGIFAEGFSVHPADTCGTIPLISIGRRPDGSFATGYNPPNILSPQVQEMFLADGTSVAYQLSYPNLPRTDSIRIEQRMENGAWVTMKAERYSVDAAAGVVTFAVPPSKPAAAGEDNIRITYDKEQHAENINACKELILFGVQGQPDRIWLAGNQKKPNICRYSQFRDGLYFGDIWYTVMGQETTEVSGFSVLGSKLVVYKNGEENERNVFLLSGSLDENGDAAFPVFDVLQGEGAAAKNSFATLLGEPLFLSEKGIVALAQVDNSSGRYLQNRSFYINGALTKEKRLHEAEGICWGRFYVLAVGTHIYLLDGNQKTYEPNNPYSAYQYECYFWNGISARRLWVWENELWFGDEAGNIFSFCTNRTSSSYQDDGKAIRAYWTTPLLNLGSWTNLKTVTDVWVVMQPYTRSGATVYYASDKDFFREARHFNMDIFDFNDIDFDRFTFNTIDRPQIASMRKKAKKVKLFQIRVENKELEEPFGISVISLRYRMGGKIKR